MKKTLFFLLIFFSVFSFYKTSFASGTSFLGTFDAIPPPEWAYHWLDPPSDAGCDTVRFGYTNGGTEITLGSAIYLCSIGGFSFDPTSWTQNVSIYFNFYNSSDILVGQIVGEWDGLVMSNTVGSPAINSQLTPVASSTVPYNTLFTGTYTDDGTYDQLIFFVDDLTPDPHQMHTSQATLMTINGSNIGYSVNIMLPASHSFSYSMALFDSSTGNHTTLTSDVAFFTSDVAFADTNGYTTCSISDLAGCFQNAIVYLFYPSQSALNQFTGLYDVFIHKPPFGYVVAINSTLSALNDTGTSAFTLTSLPILNTYVFTPIRTALIWIFWVAFAFVLFHRLKNIQL